MNGKCSKKDHIFLELIVLYNQRAYVGYNFFLEIYKVNPVKSEHKNCKQKLPKSLTIRPRIWKEINYIFKSLITSSLLVVKLLRNSLITFKFSRKYCPRKWILYTTREYIYLYVLDLQKKYSNYKKKVNYFRKNILTKDTEFPAVIQ